MIGITLDASVLALPNASADPQCLRNYINNLIRLQGTSMNMDCISTNVEDTTEEKLRKLELFPEYETVDTLLKRKNVNEYSSNDVLAVFFHLLGQPSLDFRYNIGKVLIDSISTTPDILAIVDPFSDQLEDTLVLTSILSNNCQEYSSPDCHLAIMATGIDRSIMTELEARIILYQSSRTDIIGMESDEDIVYTGSARLCEDYGSFISDLNHVQVWKNSDNEADLNLAIQIALAKSRLLRGIHVGNLEFEKRLIRDSYYRSARSIPWSNSNINSIIRATVKTIDNLSLDEVHPLNIRRGRNERQKVRQSDGAKAWRRKIDDHGRRLHYWQCPRDKKEIVWLTNEHGDTGCPE